MNQHQENHTNFDSLSKSSLDETFRPATPSNLRNEPQHPFLFQNQPNSNPQEKTHLQNSLKIKNKQKNQFRITLISICIVAVLTVLVSLHFYQAELSLFFTQFQLEHFQNHSQTIKSEKAIDPIKILALEDELNDFKNRKKYLCPFPKENNVFHVYFNKTDPQMKYISHEQAIRAQRCNVLIIGFEDFEALREKWNEKWPQKTIKTGQIMNQKTQKLLLILLHMYFNAGSYIDIQIPYPNIDDRCWKYALTGYGILYADYTQKINRFYLPDIWKFMKVRFPYAFEIKKMIEKLIDGQNVLEDCQNRQCLIIKCYKG